MTAKLIHAARHLHTWVLLVCFTGHAAWADMGAKPLFPVTVESAAAPPLGVNILAKAQLFTGKPILVRGQTAYPVQPEQLFASGDVLHIPADARLRVKFSNGDALHLGEGSIISLGEQVGATWLTRFWQGALTLYAAPSAQGQGFLETPFGLLAAGEGKLGMVIPGDRPGVTVYAFNNWRAWDAKEKEAQFRLNSASQDWSVDASWKPKTGNALSLGAGKMLRLYEEGIRVDRFSPDLEVDLTFLTSPEGETLREAAVAFEKNELDAAQKRLAELQASFPNNAQAAYYLGAIALEKGQHFEAIRQWQTFTRNDPASAVSKGIPERLTLLINQEMRAEVEKALKLESSLAQKPSPGTVAVMPFVNRGDANQAILSKGLAAMMISDLSKVPNLKVLERAKLQMLSDEIALSKSGLVDEQSSVRAGRLLRAEKLLIGDYKVQEDGN